MINAKKSTATYTLTISGGLADYFPNDYQKAHDSEESAREEYKRVLGEIDSSLRAAHPGMIFGSDGSEQSA